MSSKYGMLIKGKDNNIQIDSTNPALGLIRKQTFNMNGGIVSGNQGFYKDLPIPAHESTRIIAIKPNNIFAKVIGGAIKGSDKVVQISQPYNDTSGSVSVYEFGEAPINLFKEKYGIIIRDSISKKTVYNSNWGALKVVGYHITDWKEDIDLQLPNIQNLAFVFGGGMGGIWEDGIEGSWMDTFIKRSGNVLQGRYKEAVRWSTSGENVELSRFPSTCLIIDVTEIDKVVP